MKIGILFQNNETSKMPWQKNSQIYNRTAHRTIEMSNALIESGYEVVIFSSLEFFFNKVFSESVDLVFPCIECCFDRNTNGFIPAVLQMRNIPFIGNDSYINTIASDKYIFKNIANFLGIRTPKAILIHQQNFLNLSKYIYKIKLPCILKYQYGSMSYHTIKVSTLDELKEHIHFMIAQDNGPVLCEEYIAGHEISVPVIGSTPNEQILAVIEYTDFDAKPLEIYDEFWKGKNDSQVTLNILNAPFASIKEIIHSVHKIYRYLNYKDYARFDFRLDYQGQPYLLEGNPLPALAYKSAFDPASYGKELSFRAVLSQIVKNAANRYSLFSTK